jgi:RNA polymerase sigma factor (sigma-70 family)
LYKCEIRRGGQAANEVAPSFPAPDKNLPATYFLLYKKNKCYFDDDFLQVITLMYISHQLMTDSAIIEHLKNQRHAKAVQGLYGGFPAVKKYIIANSGTKEDAEDIYQDALVILYKKVNDAGFTLTAPLQTYLLAITKNLWFDALRRNGKLPVVHDAIEMEENIDYSEEANYRLAELSFNLLGEKCRQLLLAFYYRKHSFQQIAKSLSFSSEAVAKNQKYRCIQKAKENYSNLLKTVDHG